MAIIRTRRLAAGVIPAGAMADTGPSVLATPELRETAGYVYTCPAGFQAVVRNVDLWPLSPNVPPDVLGETFIAFVGIMIQLPAFTTVVIANLVTTTLHTSAQWQGVCVLHPGDAIYLSSSLETQPLHYQLSGAELVIPG